MQNVWMKFEKYKIRMTNPIGKGVFGEVFLCEPIDVFSANIPEKKKLVAKKISVSGDQIDVSSVSEEIKILLELKHPNIIKFCDVILTDNAIYMIMEYAEKGDLAHYMLKITDNKLPEAEILDFLKQIVSAMEYASNLKVIHRDLKPANILINVDNSIKIADFGFARMVLDPSKTYKMTKAIGSVFYMAPEVYKGEKYNSKCDVWSVGIMVYELLYGFPPWRGLSDPDHFKKIEENQIIQFPKHKGVIVSENLKDLIKGMLKIKIDERLGWHEIREHVIFERNTQFRAKVFLKDKISDLMRILTEKEEKFNVKYSLLYKLLFLLQKLIMILISINEGKSENFKKQKEIFDVIYEFIEKQENIQERGIFDKHFSQNALGFKFQETFKETCEEFIKETTKKKGSKILEGDKYVKKLLIWLIYLRDLHRVNEKKGDVIKLEVEELMGKRIILLMKEEEIN